MKKILTTFFLIISTFLLIVPTAAQATRTLEERDPNSSGEQVQQSRCQRVTERIDVLAQKYNQHKERYAIRYRAIYNRISNLITTLEEDGYDTTVLQQDLSELDSLVVNFSSGTEDLVTEVAALKQYACDGDRDGFSSSKQKIQSQIENLRTIASDIKELVTVQIKSDLQSLQN
ncbi:hypothetical protein KC678_05315 [Candidatus Dojkabacteria bacterium]|uniref:DUF5667 domain-containing protein n=1 Tax=Candidatus Dojkabacteria bacterium TaxID=2099670 RepID=A0A955RHG5_9BACT|nr:hypothetical protein [Candidatus Dojkabacteria bacterium]